MTYAFTLDTSFCSGCKACQEACKDKNGLPAGVLWRRVIEISGGEWKPAGEAWENSIFAYYLSIACNHCTHPKCAGVCPTDAYNVRTDGVVLLDASKCIGCGYCSWACPYSAPQYDRTQGIMTKCDFCYDNLDVGLPPTCVAACPLRVLEYSSTDELSTISKLRNLWQLPGGEHPFPLPGYSRTEPHLAIKLHPGMKRPSEKLVGNREEIFPPGSIEYNHGKAAIHELPLVAFTLLVQMAAGIAIWGLIPRPLPITALLAIGLLLGTGGLISFLHLGRKRNAWRAVSHLRKSWLSREILMAGLFGIAWAGSLVWQWHTQAAPAIWPLAALGVGLVYAMSRVYRLRAVPGWNTWRTQAGFFLTAILLGMLGGNLITPLSGWVWIAGLAMAFELGLALATRPAHNSLPGVLRIAIQGFGLLGVILLIIFPQLAGGGMSEVVFILALAQAAIGRWQFYAERVPFPMDSN